MNRLGEWLRRALDAIRRHERQAAWLLVAAIGLACVGLLAPPIRDRLLVRAQTAVVRWDERWAERVAHGERLLEEGRFEEAATYLAQLDGAFPARHVKHRRDIERERVLRALGEANHALGRKQAALLALRRAVAFDERNYLNHFTLARVALELGEPEEALAAFERVLAILPSHLPTVASLIAHHFERADYRAVFDVYEAYLDAVLLHWTRVGLGDGFGAVDVPVDGLWHEVDVALVAAGGGPASGEVLTVEVGTHPARVAGVRLLPPRRAGVRDAEPITLRTPTGWRAESRSEADSGAVVRVRVASQPVDVARARIELRLRKRVDVETWNRITTAYRNLLEPDALELARQRSAIGGGGTPEEPAGMGLALGVARGGAGTRIDAGSAGSPGEISP